MTWDEIREQYKDQWVLIAYDELDEKLNVISGKVVASSPNKEEIYKQLLNTKGMDIAIEYAGDTAQNLSVMFASWPSIR